MFYSKCKKCDKVRRWLDKNEVLDPKIVAEYKNKPLTQEEFSAAKKVIVVHCAGCEPKPKKKAEPVEV